MVCFAFIVKSLKWFTGVKGLAVIQVAGTVVTRRPFAASCGSALGEDRAEHGFAVRKHLLNLSCVRHSSAGAHASGATSDPGVRWQPGVCSGGS